MLGGARSGKSAHAEGLLSAEQAIYVATGRRDESDRDWTDRIAAHAARRPSAWRTVEAPTTDDVVAVLRGTTGPILVDDLATWLTGVLDDTGAWDGELTGARAECDRLLAAVSACTVPLVLVSAEVGLGVVPATRSGRLFRDELGAVNAAVAQACTHVLLLVAGIAVRLR